MEAGSSGSQEARAAFAERRRRTFYPKTDLEISVEELGRLQGMREAEAAELATRCAALFPAAKVRTVQPLLTAGTFHFLFRVEFEKGGAVYVRTGFVFRDRPNFEFLLEEQLHAVLARHDVPVPAVLRTDLSKREFPLDFQIVREAEGRPLNAIENPGTQFIPDAILEDFGRVLARLHRIEATGAGLLKNVDSDEAIEGVLADWGEYLVLNLESHLSICESSGAVSAAEREWIQARFATDAPRVKCAPMRLLHGDPGHHNVFAVGEGISAIIDWEEALAGDPVFDIAYWGTFVRDYLREPFLRGYRETVSLPPDFESRYWLYYLRVAISKTAHRCLFGYKDRPGRPPASQRIQKAIEHLRMLG